VTRLVRSNPLAVSHIPSAVNYLVTAHSVEADAPEVSNNDCVSLWPHLNSDLVSSKTHYCQDCSVDGIV